MRRIISLTATVAVAMVASAAFRPPSVPIVSCDPFFSIWSPSEDPTESDTEIWFGAKQPIRILVELDGTTYRIMGGKAALEPKRRGEDVPALRCVGCEVRALTSVFAFSDGAGRTVTLECMTAKFTDELDVFSRPVAYFTVKASGAKSVRVKASISPSLATNDDRDWTPHDLWLMERREAEIAGMKAYSLGKRRQKALSMCGDRVRCDWGWAWIVNPEGDGPETHFIVAYDDGASVEFLGDTLNAWWRRDGKAFEEMLAEAWRDYVRCREKANAFDVAFRSRAAKAGGGKYAILAVLAYRQSFAACKLVCGRDGQPLYFSKENTSNGSMGTVDVLYPQMPLLLLESPTLTRATLEPIMIYASSGRWPYDYAPHDVGTYPWGNGQTYNFNPSLPADKQTKDDTARMPVEECGNMLICLARSPSEQATVPLLANTGMLRRSGRGILRSSGSIPATSSAQMISPDISRITQISQSSPSWHSRPMRGLRNGLERRMRRRSIATSRSRASQDGWRRLKAAHTAGTALRSISRTRGASNTTSCGIGFLASTFSLPRSPTGRWRCIAA